jgi:hypothetical protein
VPGEGGMVPPRRVPPDRDDKGISGTVGAKKESENGREKKIII